MRSWTNKTWKLLSPHLPGAGLNSKMADFLAEDHEDLLLSQVDDAMEYEYVLDQAVSDTFQKLKQPISV